jgi:hypothetical protein
MSSFRSKVRKRLEKYLELDKSGIRKYLLKFVVKLRQFTVDTIHKAVSRRFKVSRKVIASMVGYIHSNLGILKAHKKDYKSPVVYSIKEEYLGLVSSMIES